MASTCRQLMRFYCAASGSSNFLLRIGRYSSSFVITPQPIENGKANFLSLQHKRRFNTQAPRPYIDPKFSYVYGKSNEHLIYSTISRQLQNQIDQSGDQVSLVCHKENKHVTYKQLGQDIDRLCKALITRFGVKKGDPIGVFAYNCYHWVLVQLACARIGAILTPINPSNKSRELAYILKKGKVKCLFLPGPLSVQNELNDHLSVLQADEIKSLAEGEGIHLRDVILMDSENELEYLKSGLLDKFKLANCRLHNWSATEENDGRVFSSLIEAEDAGVSESEACVICPDSVSPDDIFAIYYTSGTTGSPKGACVSHFTAINNTRLILKRICQGRSQSWKMNLCTTLPMFHIFAGVLNTLLIIVSNNNKIIYASHKYDISHLAEAIIKNEANVITLTPTMLIDLLTYIEQNKLSNLPLRFVQSGGASLNHEVVNRAFKVIPELEELRCGYGSTEQGSLATFHTIHEPDATRPFTVGPPIDFTEVRIVEPKTGKLVAHGEKGEVQTRGHNIMLGYLDDPEKTAEVLLPTRWYRTGDIGLMHPHGSIQICGRLKHMIIKGGENIYPEEVEQLIHTLEYVEDVHVVGLPDKRYGEQVCAWVKLKPGYREAGQVSARANDKEVQKSHIIEFCKKNITYFKVPKYLFFVDEYPMTPTKKVQNHILVKWGIERLGLHDQIN